MRRETGDENKDKKQRLSLRLPRRSAFLRPVSLPGPRVGVSFQPALECPSAASANQPQGETAMPATKTQPSLGEAPPAEGHRSGS